MTRGGGDMPRASIKLPDGTVITVDGNEEEVARLLGAYRSAEHREVTTTRTRKLKRRASRDSAAQPGAGATVGVSHQTIVNNVKDCDLAEEIEKNILDKNSRVDRVLLPLFVVSKYMGGEPPLTSGDISRITVDLGVPISQPNVSSTLSGTASKYVMGDRTRRKGQAVRYKISRRGAKYMEKVISGSEDDG
jgi:hypothetical protein